MVSLSCVSWILYECCLFPRRVLEGIIWGSVWTEDPPGYDYSRCKRDNFNPGLCMFQLTWEWNFELETHLRARDCFPSFSNHILETELRQWEFWFGSSLLCMAHVWNRSFRRSVAQLGWAPHSIASLRFSANPSPLSHSLSSLNPRPELLDSVYEDAQYDAHSTPKRSSTIRRRWANLSWRKSFQGLNLIQS